MREFMCMKDRGRPGTQDFITDESGQKDSGR